MPAVTRRGMTLAELVFAMALFAVIAGAAFSSLVVNQRTHASLRQNMDLQQTIRAGASLLPAELRELNASEGDIVAMSATSLSIRAMRRTAFLCDAPLLGGVLTARTMTVRREPFFGTRAFKAADSLLVFYEGNGELRTDDAWVLGKATGAAVAACPDGGAGLQLTLNLNLGTSANTAGAVVRGAPVRGFERVRYHLYQNPLDGNRYYLGLETASGTEPLLGPLDGANGLSFAYYDAAGAVTAVPTNVALIEVRLRVVSAKPVHRSNGGAPALVRDSLVTRVALRNNRRF